MAGRESGSEERGQYWRFHAYEKLNNVGFHWREIHVASRVAGYDGLQNVVESPDSWLAVRDKAKGAAVWIRVSLRHKPFTVQAKGTYLRDIGIYYHLKGSVLEVVLQGRVSIQSKPSRHFNFIITSPCASTLLFFSLYQVVIIVVV